MEIEKNEYMRQVQEDVFEFMHVPDDLKTQEMCEYAVSQRPSMINHVPEERQTKEMVEEAMKHEDRMMPVFGAVRDDLKTQEMCEFAVDRRASNFMSVPDHMKTQDMCNKGVMAGVDLDDIPEQFRTTDILKTAVQQNGSNITRLKDEEVNSEILDVLLENESPFQMRPLIDIAEKKLQNVGKLDEYKDQLNNMKATGTAFRSKIEDKLHDLKDQPLFEIVPKSQKPTISTEMKKEQPKSTLDIIGLSGKTEDKKSALGKMFDAFKSMKSGSDKENKKKSDPSFGI